MLFIKEEDAIYYIQRALHDIINVLKTQGITVHSKYLEMLDLSISREEMIQFDNYLATCNMIKLCQLWKIPKKKIENITGQKCSSSVMKKIIMGYIQDDLIPIVKKIELGKNEQL